MESVKPRTVLLLLFLAITLMCIRTTVGQFGRNNRQAPRRQSGGRRAGGLNPDLFQAYLELYRRQPTAPPTTTTTPQPMIPPVPPPHQIDCWIEARTTVNRSGTCSRLFGNYYKPFICQSGEFFEFNDDCEDIMRQRYGMSVGNK